MTDEQGPVDPEQAAWDRTLAEHPELAEAYNRWNTPTFDDPIPSGTPESLDQVEVPIADTAPRTGGVTAHLHPQLLDPSRAFPEPTWANTCPIGMLSGLTMTCPACGTLLIGAVDLLQILCCLVCRTLLVVDGILEELERPQRPMSIRETYVGRLTSMHLRELTERELVWALRQPRVQGLITAVGEYHAQHGSPSPVLRPPTFGRGGFHDVPGSGAVPPPSRGSDPGAGSAGDDDDTYPPF